MSQFVYATIRALGFLTRLPLPNKWFKGSVSIANDAAYFPIAGGIIGTIGAIVLFISSTIGFSSLSSAIMTIASICIITGALHEDGLSDVADGFFMHKSSAQRLKIMKDSHIGAFGTLSLIFIIGLRVNLLSDIFSKFGLVKTCIVLIMIESISRSGILWLWIKLPLAKDNGTAAAAGQPPIQKCYLALTISTGIFALFGLMTLGLYPTIISLFLSALFLPAFVRLCKNKIGGYTGDTLGAMQQCLTVILAFGIIAGS